MVPAQPCEGSTDPGIREHVHLGPLFASGMEIEFHDLLSGSCALYLSTVELRQVDE